MIRILVAMPREAEALGVPCELIGIGGTSIPEIHPDDIILNVGYCGGYQVKPGTIVEPWVSLNSQKKRARQLKTHFDGRCKSYPCFSSDEFVVEPQMNGPSIYDMELWKLAQIPCGELYCLKIVSDNLDEKECEQYTDQNAWENVRAMLKGEKLI